MIRSLTFALAMLASMTTQLVQSEEINGPRAKFNYQIFCSGCHTPDGAGWNGVPQVNGFIGHFLKTDLGREYLVRVPGSANSALDDAELAEVLNWMILEFAAESMPQDRIPYTASEVARLRQEPLFEVIEYRKQLVIDILGKQ